MLPAFYSVCSSCWSYAIVTHTIILLYKLNIPHRRISVVIQKFFEAVHVRVFSKLIKVFLIVAFTEKVIRWENIFIIKNILLFEFIECILMMKQFEKLIKEIYRNKDVHDALVSSASERKEKKMCIDIENAASDCVFCFSSL